MADTKVFDGFSGINVASGFKLQAKAPLDGRLVVASIADRDKLITENGAYVGMVVYVVADKTLYQLDVMGATAAASTWTNVGKVSDSANKLSTARSINGISFDGSADITNFASGQQIEIDDSNNTADGGYVINITASIPNWKKVNGAIVYINLNDDELHLYNSNKDTSIHTTIKVNISGSADNISGGIVYGMGTTVDLVEMFGTTDGNGSILVGGILGIVLNGNNFQYIGGLVQTNSVSHYNDGNMSFNDKIKLDAIAEGATKVTDPTAGDGKITIDGVEKTVYTHPTTSGNKHIPTGGAANQILEYSADGTAKWGHTVQSNVPADAKFTDTVYTHPTFTNTPSTSTASPAAGATFTVVDKVTTGTNGHVTAVNTKTVTLPKDTTGNAATATKLKTARTIDGLSFDGSANISRVVVATTSVDTTNKSAKIEIPLPDNETTLTQDEHLIIEIPYSEAIDGLTTGYHIKISVNSGKNGIYDLTDGVDNIMDSLTANLTDKDTFSIFGNIHVIYDEDDGFIYTGGLLNASEATHSFWSSRVAWSGVTDKVNASSTVDGLMAKEDKVKVDAMPTITVSSSTPSTATPNSLWFQVEGDLTVQNEEGTIETAVYNNGNLQVDSISVDDNGDATI